MGTFPKAMTVSIKDVARAAGVAPSTVSRALGRGPVSAEVRQLVAAAVAATGYRPNLSARRLRSRHSTTLGLIVADVGNPFFTAVSRAVEDAAYHAGMRVFLCNTDEDPGREALYLDLMQDERVCGLIVAPTGALAPPLLSGLGFPTVLIDRAFADGGHDAVVLDNHAAARMLVDHLVAQGYRRIGGLFGATSSTGAERRAGFEAAMVRHGLAPLCRNAAPSVAAGEAVLAAWLASPERPDALIVSNGLFLQAAVTASRARGLAIPGDLGLAGFDDDAWTALVEPGITVIRQPIAAFGQEAMAMLLARLVQAEQPVRKVVLSGELIIRGSTGGPRPAVDG